MNTYKVTTPPYGLSDRNSFSAVMIIMSDYYEVDPVLGNLLFLNTDGQRVAIFAKGCWSSVIKD